MLTVGWVEVLDEWYNADCGLDGGVRLDGTMLTVGWWRC